ncbi:DNA-3-methyladenine glycosylase I [Octadecabacter sp. 1_MG-2023]|uniref:DNA-3-methyladenine glycosylase I n=1 Tax=unclassified Octadecabacter TaxID=196158 RepID=UPI001C0A2B86|nr:MULTISPECIES: DNA-3-methyladenine glycosylase I [unclassified Octadecabacter]MBU2992824.1 DNA-3-methyladenine glycosylase I [Octadecabacter sp. B2R22]MDO6733725.1 DNA-3-methyladenine glycosylase I [Octadecabacter sp. 1_MG-2023]
MRHFDEILDIAADRKGGRGAVLDGIDLPKSRDEIAAIPAEAFLASFAEGIFQTGLAWTVVKNKWPDILEAFHGFDVPRIAMMSDDWFYDLVEDKRVIRSAPKIRAIQENAVMIQEAGDFGAFIADWPREDFAGLMLWLKKNGSRLGGSTGSYALRRLGVDSFLLSHDVVARLVAEGVIDKAPTSQKAMAAVQGAFNTWAEQSGRGLTEISRVLAQSVDG